MLSDFKIYILQSLIGIPMSANCATLIDDFCLSVKVESQFKVK